METGLGSLYDATNVINNTNEISVIIKIGLAHQSILGNTVEEIASQKAGIIQNQNTVFVINQAQNILNVFEKD